MNIGSNSYSYGSGELRAGGEVRGHAGGAGRRGVGRRLPLRGERQPGGELSLSYKFKEATFL